jgi:phage shock protein PspC (stress-responsive transcriptional regulator)
MKKIININLSGRVIPIEDTAYEKLKAYIESLRRYFAKEEDRDEIINDIESRIAELMNEKIRKGAQSITDADIDEIASSMGRPEDFAAEDADTGHTSGQQTYQQQTSAPRPEKKKRSRLYRDINDKFLGGVCSGIAAYLNVDPAIVRILFAIITFGGFGLGFLAYILLWIFVPAKDVENPIGKRLYRNPDDRVLAGVAGGLAAYFNREAWMIRLIFAAPILFGILIGLIRGITWHYDFEFVPNIVFGSLSSTFIVAYIVLWIVLPEARSTYEKMEMRGEKVDVNTIAQSMKDRVKDWSEEVKVSAQNIGNKAKEFANTRGKTFASEVNDVTRRSGYGCLHAIGVLFKVFFLFIAGIIALSLFAALMALIFGGVAWWPINNFLWTSKTQQFYAWGTLIFFFAIPLIAFITWLVRRIIKVRSRSSYLGWTFGALWAFGWVILVLFVSSIAKDFRVFDSATERTVQTVQPPKGKMIVAVTAPELEYTGQFNWVNNNDGDGFDLTSDTMKLSWVNFDVDKSLDSMYHVSVRTYSFGRTNADAVSRAEKIQYHVTSQDSLLDVANGFAIFKHDKWRGQRVEVSIKVPVGKKIRFDESIKRKLDPATSRKNYHGGRRNNMGFIFNENSSFWWRSNTDYVMGEDGNLVDEAHNKVIHGEYHYEETWRESDEARKEREKRDLEERERRWQEEGRRIQEQKDQRRRDSVKKVKETPKTSNQNLIAHVKPPTFSLAETFF